MTASPQAALQHIPGWETGRVSHLPGGQTTGAWLIECGTRRAVLKLDASTNREGFASRLVEADVQRNAAAHGLSGAVLYANETCLLTEYVPGSAWSAKSFERQESLDALAAAVAAIHALPACGRPFDAHSWARRYADNISDHDEGAVAFHLDSVLRIASPAVTVCCHNDLVAENLLSPDFGSAATDRAPVMFIDWEYAADNEPMFDLAVVVEHHALSERTAMRLLQSYWRAADRDLPTHAVQRLLQQRLLYRSLYWLWAASRS